MTLPCRSTWTIAQAIQKLANEPAVVTSLQQSRGSHMRRAEMLRNHGMAARDYPQVLANTIACFGLNDFEAAHTRSANPGSGDEDGQPQRPERARAPQPEEQRLDRDARIFRAHRLRGVVAHAPRPAAHEEHPHIGHLRQDHGVVPGAAGQADRGFAGGPLDALGKRLLKARRARHRGHLVGAGPLQAHADVMGTSHRQAPVRALVIPARALVREGWHLPPRTRDLFRQVVEGTSAAGYLVDHTARVTLIDQEGNLRVSYGFDTPVEDIVHDLKLLLR